jgi:hypothetical protein
MVRGMEGNGADKNLSTIVRAWRFSPVPWSKRQVAIGSERMACRADPGPVAAGLVLFHQTALITPLAPSGILVSWIA